MYNSSDLSNLQEVEYIFPINLYGNWNSDGLKYTKDANLSRDLVLFDISHDIWNSEHPAPAAVDHNSWRSVCKNLKYIRD